jgi:hypothetical protein
MVDSLVRRERERTPRFDSGDKAMTYSASTFARNLRNFARSVGVVDERMIDKVQGLVSEYVRDELEAAYFEVMQDTVVDGRPALRTSWSTENRDSIALIRDSDGGGYASLASLSFDQRRPLWIVSQDHGPLRRSADHVDLWSGVVDLPAYSAPTNRDTRTLIAVPLVLFSRATGVMHLESMGFLGITEPATEELSLLAEAIAILLSLRQAERMRASLSQDAIMDLTETLHVARFPRLAKPTVFISHSSQADPQVVSMIHEVLDEYSSLVKVIDWSAISSPAQLVDQIVRSRFGIFYLSEPAKDESVSGSRFVDNVSVVFQAGMMHSLTQSASAPAGWIPMREQDSPHPPFDFAVERIQLIPRTARGELHEARLREELRRRLGALLRDW